MNTTTHNCDLIPEVKAQSGDWLPIASAPKDGQNILICGGYHGCEYAPLEFHNVDFNGVAFAFWCEEDKCFIDECGNSPCYYHPDWWMPLPQPPKEIK